MPLFQVDLDTSYPIYHQNGFTVPKTVRELIALAESQNLGDSVIIKKHYPSYNEWYVVPFYKKQTETNVYYGTTSYLNYNSGYLYDAGIGRDIFNTTASRYSQYMLNQNGQLTPESSFEFGLKEVNSVYYFVISSDYSDYYDTIGFYVPDVSTVYIDNVPQVTYTWQSVPSISGKNGISLLSHVRDDSILTGQDISNLTPAQVKLEGTTQINSLIANVPIGKAVKAIYAGKVDFL